MIYKIYDREFILFYLLLIYKIYKFKVFLNNMISSTVAYQKRQFNLLLISLNQIF